MVSDVWTGCRSATCTSGHAALVGGHSLPSSSSPISSVPKSREHRGSFSQKTGPLNKTRKRKRSLSSDDTEDSRHVASVERKFSFVRTIDLYLAGCRSPPTGANSPGQSSAEAGRAQSRPTDDDKGCLSTDSDSCRSALSRSYRTFSTEHITLLGRKAGSMATVAGSQTCASCCSQNSTEKKDADMSGTPVESQKKHSDIPYAPAQSLPGPAVVSPATGKILPPTDTRSPVQHHFVQDSSQAAPCYNGFPLAAQMAFGSPTGTFSRKRAWIPF